MHRKSAPHRVLRYWWRKLKLVRLGGALLRDYVYDLSRYWRWSHGTDSERTREQARFALYKAYHAVEKGLALSEPRPGFGRDKIAALRLRLDDHAKRFGAHDQAPAISALHAYRRLGDTHAITDPPLATFLSDRDDDDSGGTLSVTREAIASVTDGVGADFFWLRHSVRNFVEASVDPTLIAQAVDMARKTPTVCNRQGPHVHVFENARQALDWQPGNRGFGHLAGVGLVVTVDLQAFSGRGERNQPFIDGGMFAMSLLYGLHALGLGACPLAWSAPADADRRMRAALGIASNEAVIMMIAAGHLPERFEVARAHRLPLKHFMTLHPDTRS